jgi:cell wall-associated NlpC family hydrolase
MLTPQIKKDIADSIRQGPEDEEVCGVVLSDGQVVSLANEHATPATDFQLPVDTLPKYGDELKYIFHSHWENSSPALLTPADIINARATGVASVVYHRGFDQWDLFDPNGLYPWPLRQRERDPKKLKFYVGWPWEWGRSDCLSVFRSYYKGRLGVEIQDFQRVGTEEEFLALLNEAKWNQYDEELGNQGMRKVCEGKPDGFRFKLHDVILMQLQGRRPHHVGIIVDVDKMLMLHHLQQGSLSGTVTYGGGRLRQTHSVWRHESQM